jgi:glucokinase
MRFSDPLLLGIDIGGSKVALALGEAAGTLVARRRRPLAPSGSAFEDVAALVEDCRALLAEARVRPETLERVGVSLPGPLDPTGRRVLGPPNLPGWDDVPIADWLERAFGRPVRLENDANAAALAEWQHGAGRGCANLVYLTMSTGVGGGIVVDGQLYRGARRQAGEIGHMPVEWDGEPCACGMRGCLEAYVGGAAWTRRLRACAPADSAVTRLAGGRDAVAPEHVVTAAGQGDAFALAELARFNDYLARGITLTAFVLEPERVILGTIPTAAGEALCLEPVRRRVRTRLWPGIADGLEIVSAALGEELPYRAGLAAAGAGEPG